jgi:hypothetical protein
VSAEQLSLGPGEQSPAASSDLFETNFGENESNKQIYLLHSCGETAVFPKHVIICLLHVGMRLWLYADFCCDNIMLFKGFENLRLFSCETLQL